MGFAAARASHERDRRAWDGVVPTREKSTFFPTIQVLEATGAKRVGNGIQLASLNVSEAERQVMSHEPNEETPPLIRMRAITKVFYTDEIETHALSGVHCDIRRGEFVSISGPSGCGKSTLLAILGLLDTPSTGEYYLSGRSVATIGANERATIRNREIGFIFQSFNLIGDLDVYQNVELPLTYRQGFSRDARRKAVMQALERVGMAHRLNHFPSQLSGGQQQRVAVARALAGSPSILLADEPTGNLY